MSILGIDIGGTTIKGGLVADGKVSGYRKVPTCAKEGRAGITRQLLQLIGEIGGSDPVGISTAGRVDPERGVVTYATDNLPGWTGFDLKTFVQERTGRQTAVINDAVAALLGEVHYGAARGYRDVVMITIGTGIGSAVLRGGAIPSDPDDEGGWLGHLTYVEDGRPCTCGKRGCLETYISATALKRDLESQGFSTRLDGAFASEDKRVKAIIDGFLDRLSDAVLKISDRYRPELVVIGGGVVEMKERWWEAFLDRLGGQVAVAPAELGNDAGIMGAAYFMQSKL